jgi:UDP-N-acetylglucosamine diphosphorylase / glucose-1-phosphate thymidylyltransferase / UDP-N-acetylgalactosamine diphosphorylase / glucosamine-1-phosphate N-acetyltransferase / galactosamine-1-phosphate N-acetyltransferase
MLLTKDLFCLDKLPQELQGLLDTTYPWEVLKNLDAFTATIQDQRLGNIHPTAVLEGNIYIHPSAVVGPHAYIEGPAWIGEEAEVGHAAYIRGGVVLAPYAKVGAKTEVKRSLFLYGAKAPHLNYVGDSILGSKVNLGAGVKLANFNNMGTNIKIEGHATGLRKLGAMLGDEVTLGCNAVTVPGTIVGPRSMVYNCVMLRGVIPADSIVKLRQDLEIVIKTPLP